MLDQVWSWHPYTVANIDKLQPVLPCRIDGSGVLVAEGVGAVQAHLDLHFRLMHHDLLAELIDATCCFKALGGIGMLNARQKRQVCGHWGSAPMLTKLALKKTSMAAAVTGGADVLQVCARCSQNWQGVQHTTVARLACFRVQGRGSTTRVDLQDGASLTCYRHVAVESLMADPRQGVYFEVSFDEPDFVRKMRGRDKVSCTRGRMDVSCMQAATGR